MTDRDCIIRYAINWLKRMRVREPTLVDVTIAVVKAKRLNKVWRGRYGIVAPHAMSYRVGLMLCFDIGRELNPAFYKRLLEEGTTQRQKHMPKTKRSRTVIREVRGYDIPAVRTKVPRSKQSKRLKGGWPDRTEALEVHKDSFKGAFGEPPKRN